jgi:hypothetical protein
LLEGDFLSSLNLPKAGQSGLGGTKDPSGVAVSFQFRSGDHSGADEAHFASQDIPELRTFIKAQLSQKCAKARDSRIISQLGVEVELEFHALVSLKYSVRVLAHSTQLEGIEFAVRADDTAPVQHGAAILEPDKQGANGDHRRKQDQED